MHRGVCQEEMAHGRASARPEAVCRKRAELVVNSDEREEECCVSNGGE